MGCGGCRGCGEAVVVLVSWQQSWRFSGERLSSLDYINAHDSGDDALVLRRKRKIICFIFLLLGLDGIVLST